MEFFNFINSVHGIACILSMKRSGQEWGDEITIVAANQSYLRSVNRQDEEFVPNRPYTYYVPHDPNFEALVNDCVRNRKIAHQYVNAELYSAWIDIYMIPLEEDQDGNGYCIFSYEMTLQAESEKLIDISAKTAYMVLKTCIKLRENSDFKASLKSIVKDIRVQCESDACAIILIDTEKEMIDYLCFDHAEHFPPAEDDIFLKPEFYGIVKRWRDIMGGSNCMIIPKKEELEELKNKDEEWYNTLVYSGVDNIVLYPLRDNDNLYGYIFANNFNSDKTAFIREVMELNSFILSAEVENYRMHQKLKMLSRTDVLTGVLNRNALNRRISDLSAVTGKEAEGLGVVFVDLNGLKTVNDSFGHNEGDEILKNVSSKIRSVYEGKEIYRAGGDEFIVIITGIEKAEFDSLFNKLNSLSRVEGEPSFALGSHFDDGDMTIKNVMKLADADMYKNKADYYSLHPDADRRNR